MLAIHFLGNTRISLDQVPIPNPQGQNVVVRIRAAGICGTDRRPLEGRGQDTIPGHENAGEVVGVDRPSWVREGERVAINCHVTCHHCSACLNGDLYFCHELQIIGGEWNGGYAEYCLVPETCCVPLPTDISFQVGALMVDVMGTAFRGMKRGQFMPGDKVAIWGAGPIGLSAVMIARHLGAMVASIDIVPSRLERARECGAALVVNAERESVVPILRDWTSGCGVDVAYDCVGSQKAAREAVDAVKNRGRVGIIGVSQKLDLNPEEDFIAKELTLFGSRNSTVREWDEMIACLRSGLRIDRIVTHHFPLAQAETAFEVFRGKECGKVIFAE
jgi:propanol-preferring alcohol dehydrogenase